MKVTTDPFYAECFPNENEEESAQSSLPPQPASEEPVLPKEEEPEPKPEVVVVPEPSVEEPRESPSVEVEADDGQPGEAFKPHATGESEEFLKTY